MRKPGECCAPTRMAAPTPCVTCPPSCLRSPTQALRSASRPVHRARAELGRARRAHRRDRAPRRARPARRTLAGRARRRIVAGAAAPRRVHHGRPQRPRPRVDRRGCQMARRDGSAFGALVAVAYRAWCHVRLGDLALTESEMQTVADVAHPNDLQLDVATIYWFLCDAIGERTGLDALAGAVEALEPQGEFARTMAGAMMREAAGRYRCALVARWSRSARRCGG